MFGIYKKYVGLTKKLFIAMAVYISILALFNLSFSDNRPAHIEDPYTNKQSEIYKTINDPKLNSTPQGRVMVLIYRGTLCSLIGEGCTKNIHDADKNYSRSLFGRITNVIAIPYSAPPASFAYWLRDGMENAGFIPKSYAAEGVGFASIRGYRTIWSLFRNLSYLILVLVIVTIGFMIMFRMKINPQTVISVENALPRIVTTLLFITFSFAIAGFFIDIMYVLIGISVSLLAQMNIGALKPENIPSLINENIGATFANIWPYDHALINQYGGGPVVGKAIEIATGPVGPAIKTGYAFFNVLPAIIQIPFRGIIAFSVGNFLTKNLLTTYVNDFFASFTGASILGNTLGALPSLASLIINLLIFGVVTGFIPGLILGIFILITILKLLVDIFAMLLMSYINIIILVVFSPFIILMEAIPGRNTFSGWVKGLMGELLTFPLVILFTLVGYAVVAINHSSQIFRLPFLYGFSSDDMSTIVGLGIILLIPQFVKAVKKSLGMESSLPISADLNTFFGGAAALGALTGTVGGGYSTLLRGQSPFRKRLFGDPSKGGPLNQFLDYVSGSGAYSANYKESAAGSAPVASPQGPKQSTT